MRYALWLESFVVTLSHLIVQHYPPQTLFSFLLLIIPLKSCDLSHAHTFAYLCPFLRTGIIYKITTSLHPFSFAHSSSSFRSELKCHLIQGIWVSKGIYEVRHLIVFLTAIYLLVTNLYYLLNCKSLKSKDSHLFSYLKHMFLWTSCLLCRNPWANLLFHFWP